VKDQVFYQSSKSYLISFNKEHSLKGRKKKNKEFYFPDTFGHIIRGISCTSTEGKEFCKPQFWKYVK